MRWLRPFWVLSFALGFQAVAGVVDVVGVVRADSSAPWSFRLHACEEDRIDRAFGEQASVWRELASVLPAEAVVFNCVPASIAEATLADVPRVRLAHRLKNVFYPRVFATAPDPVALIEAKARCGAEVWLVWLRGDPQPTGREWTRAVAREGFALYRFRRS